MQNPNAQIDSNIPQPTPENPNPGPTRTPTPPETPQRDVPTEIPLPGHVPSPGPEPHWGAADATCRSAADSCAVGDQSAQALAGNV